ncbi:MAG: 2-amino-4-hydroxy-6-hydroxymethyldihydropteridine diphosphokinase [Leptospirales bacterium]|jgi:2-amino-4-hydroxy-6-hydroxymethyldihydropteridine diphosphokinase
MARSLLSLGSNVGDRGGQLAAARHAIAAHAEIQVIRASSVLENTAILFEDQPDFLNQILEVETRLTPLDLLLFLQALEQELGRIPRFKYGPREIDLDILSYDRLKLNTTNLTLPHPGVRDRGFLHRLLAEFGVSPLELEDERS